MDANRSFVRPTESQLESSPEDKLDDVIVKAQKAAEAILDEVLHIDCDHNHVVDERLSGEPLWVHRKGAISAQEGEPGTIPGSMGTWSFHVEGRGETRSLHSSSHGSGRELARGEARRTITRRDFERQLQGVYYDVARADQLRDEAPSAYKDVAAVMRAQRDLTRIVRRLRPRLVYKGWSPRRRRVPRRAN